MQIKLAISILSYLHSTPAPKLLAADQTTVAVSAPSYLQITPAPELGGTDQIIYFLVSQMFKARELLSEAVQIRSAISA